MVKKWILSEFLKNSLPVYIFGLSALVITSLLQTYMPKLLGYITDCLKDRLVSLNEIYKLTFYMLGIAAVIFCTKYIWRYCLSGKARDLECFLRAKLFAHLQTLPVKFYNNRKTGDLMAYAINDLGAVRQAFAFGIFFIVDGIVINLVSILVMVKFINPVLTVVSLAPILISVSVILFMKKRIRERYILVQNAFSDISDKVQENISGIRVVKGFVQEQQEIQKLNAASENRKSKLMHYVKLSGLLGPTSQICFGLSFSLGLAFGGIYVSNGIITLGDFIAFNTYLGMLMGPVGQIGKIVEVWQRAFASIKRLDDIFAVKTDILDNTEAETLQIVPEVDTVTEMETCIEAGMEKLKGKLEIKGLSFSYPGIKTKALKNINISLEPGKTLAIIGKTGSGKTTLANLLLRLYKVERGLIFLDGKDINDIPVNVLRDSIGYVPQDNFLFSATIKENISFFKEGYEFEEIEEAARAASVYENIADFPEGFDTVVGERGITLSGGQKQRISIARAIIKDPAVLILDDSLSAVDTKTEEEILRNIKSILKGRAGILIAHRISTIKHADEIIMLDKGKIIERGTHEELIALQGHYYKLYIAQMAENKLETVANTEAFAG